MRPSQRRRWKNDDEPSPRERRAMMERGEWKDEDEAPSRAPVVFRIIAWTSLVFIFFAVGYGATSLAFNWLDRRATVREAPLTPSNLSASPEQTLDILARIPQQAPAPDGEVWDETLPDSQDPAGDGEFAVLSIWDGTKFDETRRIRPANALQEDRIKQVLAAYMDAMKENQMLDAGVQDLNIFQSGDWLYLNMNGAFLESIKTLGAEKSRIMLTGMVKTMTDNFAPINRIKFYVDGREVTDRNPVDLTAPWGISTRSS